MSEIADRTMRIVRTFSAPRSLVFDAWTSPQHLDRWMGPRGFVTTTSAFDFRVGGEWLYTMAHPEYGTFPNRTTYIEIVPGERLVYTLDAGADGDAEPIHVTVLFRQEGDETTVTMESVLPSDEAMAEARKYGAETGGHETMAKLGELLDEYAGGDLIITRTLSAPRSRVWQAWTNTAQLGKWWGPAGFTMAVARHELRPGGLFHYSMTGPAGTPMAGTMWGRMVYVDIQPEERIVWINSFANEAGELVPMPMAPGWPAEIHNTLTLVDRGSSTEMTLRGRPLRATAAERASYIQNHPSMRAGFGGSFVGLERLLAEG